jgi:hypothetical protein
MMTKSPADTQATPEQYAAMRKMVEEMTKNGVLLATGGLSPTLTHFKASGGKITFTDGPFTEAKEVVVGFALFEAKSQEEAVEYSKLFWKAYGGDGEGDMHQVFG